MDEENFIVSFIAAIIGVLPILFLSIIACERKKSRRAPARSHRKKTSSKRKPSKSKSSTLKSDKCAECERFDAQVDAAINSRNNISILQTNGGCNINGHEITPKRCEHGNGRDIIIDRPGLRMTANGNIIMRGTYVDGNTSDKSEFDQERYMKKLNKKKAKRISKLNKKKAKRDRKKAKRLAKYNKKMEKYNKKKAALTVSDSENETECESD